MTNLSDLRLSKNMKYTALYWAMRFFETKPDIFTKKYSIGETITINAVTQEVSYGNEILFFLNTRESFVVLECLNRLLELGYMLNEIIVRETSIEVNDCVIHCYEWDVNLNDVEVVKLSKFLNVAYKSRLVSGVLEYENVIRDENGEFFQEGIFDQKSSFSLRKKKVHDFINGNFIFAGNRLIKYVGHESKVVVPYGVEVLESSCFWDNQCIEEVILPESLTNYGGDTFYNCKKLKKINIPSKVKIMGNNPFAGCPLIEVTNESKCFQMIDGVLFSKNMDEIIYYPIRNIEESFSIPEGTIIIGKHCFYLCDNLKEITLPKSLLKMENNPFSGCSKLNLINHSTSYFIQDNVIYNKYKNAVVGTLNKIHSDKLVLLPTVKTINRNSFWNCKGIKQIVLPKSLEDIGYNPFVGCSNIIFESESKNYKVVDGILYNNDLSKIVCYPASLAIGEIHLRDSVITLERGAFSGCDKMTSIHLHNVNIINKSCFTNCSSLKSIYIPDWVTYIGEWAFAYCTQLEEVSVYKEIVIDNNAFSNANKVNIIKRENHSNYLIESENLYSLKSLQMHYQNRIDSILIDPPYNSDVDYIGYQDTNFEDGYNKFMDARINLSFNLLSNKGFLVINIDEGEVEELKNICLRYFDSSLVSIHRWKKKHPYFDTNRVVLNPNKVQTDYEFIIICKKTLDAKFKLIKQPYIVDNHLEEKESEVPDTFDCFGTTSSAKDEIKEIFGSRDFFSTPKPVKLMKELIRATTQKDSIIVDYFAGSGTTGQAADDLNYEDDGNQVFVLVSNSESDICKKITNKRLNITLNNKHVFIN